MTTVAHKVCMSDSMQFICVFVWGVNTSSVSLVPFILLYQNPLDCRPPPPSLLFWSENVSPLSLVSIRFFLLFSVCYLRFLLSLSCERFYSLESLFPWFPCRQAVKAAAL